MHVALQVPITTVTQADLKQKGRPSFGMLGSPTLLGAVRARQHFLTPVGGEKPAGDAASSPPTAADDEVPVSPTSAAAARAQRRATMEFLGKGDGSSLPRRVLRAYLAVELLMEVQQAVKQQLLQGARSPAPVKSPSKKPPKAQKSHVSLEMSDAAKGGKGSTAVVVADSIDAEFLAAQKAAHLTVRKAVHFTMQSSYRLLWLSLMGDTSFWQEAMHLQHGLTHNRLFYYVLLPLMVFLQAIAWFSQVCFAC